MNSIYGIINIYFSFSRGRHAPMGRDGSLDSGMERKKPIFNATCLIVLIHHGWMIVEVCCRLFLVNFWEQVVCKGLLPQLCRCFVQRLVLFSLLLQRQMAITEDLGICTSLGMCPMSNSRSKFMFASSKLRILQRGGCKQAGGYESKVCAKCG